MTKKELATEVAFKNELNAKDVERTIDLIVDKAKEAVKNGDTIHIRGFGSLGVKQRKAKKAQNIKAGVTIEVPAHKVPYFKPSPEFKALVR